MAEIVYKYVGGTARNIVDPDIRWLNADDYAVFAEHLKLCGQRVLERAAWNAVYERGDRYIGYFTDGIMVSRASVEKYSAAAWEIGDVRTAKDYRNRGYAYRLCEAVLRYIRDNNIEPTMRTEEDNYTMQRIIERLGFVRF